MTGTKCCHFSSIGTWKICNDEQCHKRKKDKLGFDVKLIENNDDGSDKEYIRKADVKYPKKLHELHSDLLFLLERMKFENSEKLVCNPYNKKNCYTHKIPKALYHGLLLQKKHRVIKLNQEAWPEPYIDLIKGQRTRTKSSFEKYFFKLMNNLVFRNTIKNVRKHRHSNLWKLTKEEVF